MSQEQKRVSAREFKELVEAGMKKPEIAKHFDIPELRVTQYLQQLKLRIKATRGGGSLLILDLEEETNENQLEIPFGHKGIEAPLQLIEGVNVSDITNNVVEIEETTHQSESIPDIIGIEDDLSQGIPFEEAFEESSEIQTVNSL